MSSPPPRPAWRPDFEIAILCALPVEADAVLSIFDEDWDENADGQPYDKAVGDPNAYTTGLVGRHNVVLAHLGNMGNVSSASAAASFRWSFPNIKLALIVGILGVVPFDPKETGITRKTERVLGDVIISEGVVQYDFGRQYSNRFVVKNTLRDAYGRPNLEIRSLLAKLKSKTYRKRLQQKMAEYLKLLEIKDGLEYKYPGKEFDVLFPLGYRHIADDKECDVCCDKSKPIKRTRLQQGLVNPMVHFGITLFVGPPKAVKAGPWHSQLQKNRNFVGRTELIDDLTGKRFIGDDDGHQRIAVTGLGGVGKTQLALKICFWVKENKPEWSVFWIQALSMASFEKSCRDIASLLYPDMVENQDAKELVKNHLSSVTAGYWLLVVDNIDNETLAGRGEEGIRDFFPRSNKGKILFTTRYRHIAHQLAQSEIINLERMVEGEAKELLSKSLVKKPSKNSEQDVFELLEFLTYLPLAITQAASYMNVTTVSVSQYIRLLRNTQGDMIKLLETECDDDNRDPKQTHAIVSTWVVSFEQIRKDRGAAKLLSLIAHIEFKAIPPSIFPSVGLESEQSMALGVLCGYSFLTEQGNGATYDMHRLVHFALQIWVKRQCNSREQRQDVLVHRERIFSTDKWGEREKWRQTLPHVLKAVQSDGKDKDSWQEENNLGYWAGRCLMAEAAPRWAHAIPAEVPLYWPAPGSTA
uniref:NB-ARC domain-containing protein n=1 Tax=Pyricularia oryzae (strain P131) TaxID=1143193 RepID=L7JMW3_PYRO1